MTWQSMHNTGALAGLKVPVDDGSTVGGSYKLGSELAGGSYTLPVATSTVLGGVKQGSGVTIAGDGTISASGSSYTLPVATSSVLGGVKQGSGVTIAGDGTIGISTIAPSSVMAGDLTARPYTFVGYRSDNTEETFGQAAIVSYVVTTTEKPQAVAYAATVTIDASAGRTVVVGALTGNVVIANPINLTDGQTVSIRLAQDGTGSRTVTWGSMFKFAGGVKALSTAANAVDRFVGVYYQASNTIEGSLATGFA